MRGCSRIRVQVGEPHPRLVSALFELFDDRRHWPARPRAQVEDFRGLAGMKNCRDSLRPQPQQLGQHVSVQTTDVISAVSSGSAEPYTIASVSNVASFVY